jgi:hypothetical protein
MPATLELREILKEYLETAEDGVDLSKVTPAKLPSSSKAKNNKKDSDWKLAVLLPDAQIGYRKYEDGSLDPFHDDQAIDIAMQILSAVDEEHGVDIVINLGDTLDLPMYGKYMQEDSFANSINETLRAGHTFFAAQRALAPNARVVYLEGNHDCRLEKYIREKAPAARNIRRVDETEHPALSLPNLLAFDDIKVEYIGGYPAGYIYLNENLMAMHGDKARSNGSTAYQYINANPHITTLFGHSHRFELAYKTHSTMNGPKRNGAFSPGCLCRVDGAVPSVKGGINLEEKPVRQFENWQQGMGLVWYKESGEFTIEPIHIINGWAVYAGQEFRAIS